jgi:hypothetical protein
MNTDHIVHHLLSIFALGASPSQIDAAYDLNKKYQLPAITNSAEVAHKLHEPAFFDECLGQTEYYQDFMKFFQGEIDAKGVEAVVNEYVFKGDKRADDMLVRMYSGLPQVRPVYACNSNSNWQGFSTPSFTLVSPLNFSSLALLLKPSLLLPSIQTGLSIFFDLQSNLPLDTTLPPILHFSRLLTSFVLIQRCPQRSDTTTLPTKS